MQYFGDVYRPPSEAQSLILQLTLGCSHNKCTFCTMYKNKKFAIRSYEDIKSDIEDLPYYYENPERIFLADGDALIVKQEDLLKVLRLLKNRFPSCKRTGIYGSPKAILSKSVNELSDLKNEGLGIVYLGVESGSDHVLQKINKGATSKEILEAGKRVKASGLKLSTTLISGIGGRELTEEHALNSASLLSEMEPDYLGLLSLIMDPSTKLYKDMKEGRFTTLTPVEILKETRLLIENLNLQNTVFRSNHASNYLPLRGTLNKDKALLIETIDNNMEKIDIIAAHKIQRL